KAVGLDVEGLTIRELGEVIYEYLIELLEDLKIPTTLREIGFGKEDLNDLVEGTMAQRGLLARAPKTITKEDIEKIFLEMIE
ncbi:MAG: iron-containing alcohol dehydrogenase, partial [Candidatus Methanomethylicia archaeon]